MFPDSRQKGVALVLVLWITVLLTIMAGAFTLTIQREAQLIGNLKARSEANALAEAGVYYALLMMSINDPERVWKADGSIHELVFNGGVLAIRIGDERGKIDLNYAGRDLLVAMFTDINLELEEADKLADAILDWRDKNDEVHLNGAEEREYKQNNLTYAPRNGLFQSIEELQFVLGMTPQVFKAVQPMLTVYSYSSAVDKTKAPDDVLRILEALAEGGTDKNAAPSGGARLNGNIGTNSETDTDTENANRSRKTSAGGGIYTIDAEALLPGGHTGRIRVVARRGAGSAAYFGILSWKYMTARSGGSPPDANFTGDADDFY